MKRNLIAGMIICGIALFFSCNNAETTSYNNKIRAEKKFLQQEDGTISLNIEKADRYSDKVNPSSNTAEWNVVVSKSGRFDVWLSSATKDTVDLHYKNSVMLSILDHRLEARPGCDKIIQNSNEVSYPYFRADSFMGSLYIQDTGLFTIQLISEKVVLSEADISSSSQTDQTKLMSVILVPLKK